jgi:hypothetical protein
MLVVLEEGDVVEQEELAEEVTEPSDIASIDLAGAVGVYLLTTTNIVLDSDVNGQSYDLSRTEEGPIHFARGTVISTFDDFEEMFPGDEREIREARETAIEGSRYVARIPQSAITGMPSKDFLYLACQERDRVIEPIPPQARQKASVSVGSDPGAPSDDDLFN